MKAFRIGRKPMGPWLNMTPPIRRATHPHSIPDLSTEAVRFDEEKRISGVFAPADDADAHRHAAVGSDAPADSDAAGTGQDLPALTLTPSAGSADSLDAVDEKEQCLQTSCQLEPILSSCSRRTSSTNGSTTPQRPDTADHGKYDEKTELLPRTIKRLSPDEYTSWAIEQGKHLDIRNYPSLEQPVQQAITEKYMKMHDQIIEEGLYQCRYLEYGKEMVRYTTLFALSMTALYHAWYMTSAVFLGLFWVRCCSCAVCITKRTLLIPNSIKSCLPPMTPATEPLRTSLLSTPSLACLLPTFAAACPSDGGRAAIMCTT